MLEGIWLGMFIGLYMNLDTPMSMPLGVLMLGDEHLLCHRC